jgi:hypothetical protein
MQVLEKKAHFALGGRDAGTNLIGDGILRVKGQKLGIQSKRYVGYGSGF